MSHFSVLVVGPDPEGQLQPYHEFECTGEDDEYVQSIDVTAKDRKDYEGHTEERYMSPEGELHSPLDDQFFNDPSEEEVRKVLPFGSGWSGGKFWMSKDWGDGRGYRPRFKSIPEGWKSVRLKAEEMQSFADFINDWRGAPTVKAGNQPDLEGIHKYGYVLLDEAGEVLKSVDRTNPNKKWDWYQVGGRYNGRYRLKSTVVAELEAAGQSRVGRPGIQKMDEDYEHPGVDRADVCLKREVDVDGMMADARAEAFVAWTTHHELVAGLPAIELFSEVEERLGWREDGSGPSIEAVREAYHAQPGIKRVKESKFLISDDYLANMRLPLEEYQEQCARNALTTFAYIKDGEWHERGDMGWWGIVTDEKSRESWADEFWQMWSLLPDDALLTVVDCHI